jgi:hypothetical protein
MNRTTKTRLAVSGIIIVAAIVALMWPAATWLQRREMWLTDGKLPDAIYLVAGSHDQDRRISGIVSFLAGNEGSLRTRKDGERGQPNYSIQILIGNDKLKSAWSSEEQRNLAKGEWAVKKLETKSSVKRMRDDGLITVKIMPGQFDNTDGEMTALAAYLKVQPEIRTLALSTSPFHLRRVVWRLKEHLDRDLVVVAVKVQPAWHDRLPWIVAGELGKMTRDWLLGVVFSK